MVARLAAQDSASWTNSYLRQASVADFICALAAGLLAFQLRSAYPGHISGAYLAVSLGLPVIWVATMAMAGGYDSRFIGVGSDEFRRVLNAGVSLTAAVAILSYATKTDLARGYVVIALPCVTLFDLVARYMLRKRLHKLRKLGSCMRKVVVVGHSAIVEDLTTMLRRENHHGLSVVAACIAGPRERGWKSAGSRRSAAWATWPTWSADSTRTWWPCWPARR